MKTPKHLLLSLLVVSLFILVACREEDENQPPGNNNGGNVPQGMTRLYGSVRDAASQPVSDVALHVVYDFNGASPIHDVQQGSVTNFYTTQVLHTTCDGTTPLPDGIMVKIFWDVDSDGNDPTDPQPPLCDDPPNCDGGPAATVNLIEFPINGAATDGVPGTFHTDPAFLTVGARLVPNIFYMRIYCNDGSVLYTSNPVEAPEGPSEINLAFNCTSCSGVPEIPEWRLDQGYPNPTVDSATVTFGLEQAASPDHPAGIE